MQWVNLEKFGIQLKKAQMSNGVIFPVIVVNDIEKYKNSGCLPLEFLNDPNNNSGVIKLAGNGKGRGFNQPIYMLTKSFHNGQTKYNLKDTIANLLQIQPSTLDQYYYTANEKDIVVENGFADFDKFKKITAESKNNFFGESLYIVKDQSKPESLIDASRKLIDQQHGLFPKNTIENIPFRTLDAFGLNSSVLSRAFLSVNDAVKNGIAPNQLETLPLNGGNSVLPVSINVDGSVTIIQNPQAIPALAYSNYAWQKNFPLVKDYTSLLAVRNASRALLNARAKDITSAADMDAHLKRMAVTFQNFNEATNVTRLHKPMKFNDKGVAIFLAQNKEEEWRYIERSGSGKLDEPLNWDNYQKALHKLAENNNILKGSFDLLPLDKIQLDSALDKVYIAQKALFKKYVKVVDGPEQAHSGMVVVNNNGKKINTSTFETSRRNFTPDVGGSLASVRLNAVINSLDQAQTESSVNDIMGQIVDSYTLSKNVTRGVDLIPKKEEQDLDILEVYEQALQENPGLGSMEISLKEQGLNLDMQQDIQVASDLPIEIKPEINYSVLPKNMSSEIDKNYEELNPVYQTYQRLVLSDLPYWNAQLESMKQEHKETLDKMLSAISQQMESIAVEGQQTEISVDPKLEERIAELGKSIAMVEDQIGRDEIKAVVLSYQMSKFTKDIDSLEQSNLVYNSNENGEYVPFESKTEFNNAVSVIRNKYALDNAKNGGLVKDNSFVRQRIESFVNSHYKPSTGDIELTETIQNYRNNALDAYRFVDLPAVKSLKITHLPENVKYAAFKDLLQNINQGLDEFNQNFSSDSLDEALIRSGKVLQALTNQTGIEINLGNRRDNQIFTDYAKLNNNKTSVKDMQTGLPLSDRFKLDALKKIATLINSNSSQAVAYGLAESSFVLGRKLALAYTTNANMVAAIDNNEFQANLAGKFSVINQSSNSTLNNVALNNIRYGLNQNDPVSPFKVIAYDVSKEHDHITTQLNSSTFNGAKQQAFGIYQLQSTLSQFGVTANEYKGLSRLANAIESNDQEGFKALSKEYFGRALRINDIKNMDYSIKGANGFNSIYNFTTPHFGSFTLDPLPASNLLNQVQFLNALTGQKTVLDTNALIMNVKNQQHYDHVQKYLHAEPLEVADIKGINSVVMDQGSSLSALKENLATHAINTYQKSYASISDKSGVGSLITTIPSSGRDNLISRIVPKAWISGLKKEDLASVGLNAANLGAISADQEKLKSITRDAIESHIVPGNGQRIVSHLLPDTNADITSSPIELNQNQTNILKAGQYDDFNQVAIANLEAALNNHFKDALDLVAADDQFRILVGTQKGAEIPELRIVGANTPAPLGYKPVLDISGKGLVGLVEESGIRFNANEGQFLADWSKSFDPNTKFQKIHESALASTGFNLDMHQSMVMQLHNKNNEDRLDFMEKLGAQNLTFDSVVNSYETLAAKTIENIQTQNAGVKTVYLSLGHEAEIPSLLATDVVTPNSLAIDVNSPDLNSNIKQLLTQGNGVVTDASIIDAIQPVRIPVDQVNADSLAIVRKNFIEQNNQLGFKKDHDQLIDSAPLYAVNDGQNITFALVGTKDRAQQLNSQGAIALIGTLNIGQDIHKNVLAELATNAADPQKVISLIQNMPVQENKLEGNVLHALSVFDSPQDALSKVTAQKDLDAQKIEEPVIPTAFAEPLAQKYEDSEILKMSNTDIDNKLNINRLWPTESIEKHVESNHQNLDALLLSRTIRANMPHLWKVAGNTESLNTKAVAYMHFVDEVHKAVSSAKTVEDVALNYKGAVINTAKFDPNFFVEMPKEVSVQLHTISRAANQIENGMQAEKALNNAIEYNPDLKYQYQKSVMELAYVEKLLDTEKSFIHYMNGAVLNAPASQVAALNSYLTNRLIENKLPEPPAALNEFQTQTPELLLSSNNVKEIDAKSPVNFDSGREYADLNQKWGITTTISENVKPLERGYINALNKELNEIHQKLGGDERISSKNMGFAGLNVNFGVPENPSQTDLSKSILLFASINRDMGHLLVNHIVSKIESAEIQLMPKDVMEKFVAYTSDQNDYAVQNKGLMSFVVDQGYKPQTEAVNKLVEIHQMLKDGFGEVSAKKPSQELVEHATMIETQKYNAFARHSMSYDSYDDDMRHRDFILEGYISSVVTNFCEKQDKKLADIEKQAALIAKKHADAPDIYQFERLSDQLKSVTNITISASRTQIEKYADKLISEKRVDLQDFNKESIVDYISTSIERHDRRVADGEDYLSARAANKFTQILDKYATEEAKNSQEYIRQVDTYFKLGESSEIKPAEYNSDFAKALLLKMEKESLREEFVAKPTPDDIVQNYIYAAMLSPTQLEERNLVKAENANELSSGIDLLIESLKSQENMDRRKELDNDLKKESLQTYDY